LSVITGSYATLAEADRAGAIERGWIPRGLPSGAHDLREAHDEAGRRWGLFNFPSAEADALRSVVGSSEIPMRGLSCEIPGRVEWWPVALRGSLDEERVRATGLKAYRSRDGLIFLINWNQGRAYYWSE